MKPTLLRIAALFSQWTFIRPAIALLAAATFLSPAKAAEPVPPVPPFSSVERFVRQQFKAAQRDPRDLITKSDAKAILDVLNERGMRFRELKLDFDVYVPDNHFLVPLVKSPEFREALKSCTNPALLYDRLDRLSSFPEGQKLARKLIAQHDVRQFDQLCSTQGNEELTRAYGHRTAFKNLEITSGRVYTLAGFLDHLRTLHELAARNLALPDE